MSSAQSKTVTGQCLCGSARFEVDLKGSDIHACHCDMCRSWGGGPFMGVDCVSTPRFEKEDVIGRYSASEWGERLFCKNCGSSLVWQTKSGEHVSVSAGLIELDPDAAISVEFFIDSKPGYYALAGGARTMTGEEIFAAFAAGQEG